MKKEKVMVVPLCGGQMLHVTQALLAHFLPVWGAAPNVAFSFDFRPEIGTSPQDFARNVVCGDFLKSDCDVLLMLDDDMTVSGSVLDLLATPDYDIAAPLQYMVLPPAPEKGRHFPECKPCAFTFDMDAPEGQQLRPAYPLRANIKPGEPVGCSRVEAVGSGVMAIRRAVLADERMLLEPGLDPPALWKNIFRNNAQRVRGLDIDFCRRAHELGYRIVVNWDVQVGHFKRMNLNDADAMAKAQFVQGFLKGQTHEQSVA